jgi:hypothetical protein
MPEIADRDDASLAHEPEPVPPEAAQTHPWKPGAREKIFAPRA